MTQPFACDMTAIPAGEREAHHALIRRLMDEVVCEVRQLPIGFELRFAADEYNAVAEFVGRERRCCPFLEFTLTVAPEGGPLVLRMTGAEGAGEFIRAELGLGRRTLRREQWLGG